MATDRRARAEHTVFAGPAQALIGMTVPFPACTTDSADRRVGGTDLHLGASPEGDSDQVPPMCV